MRSRPSLGFDQPELAPLRHEVFEENFASPPLEPLAFF
jgi:hypothetical protein